jgi:mono/diheme cytochrome c family protein
MKTIITQVSKMKLSGFILIGALAICSAFIPKPKGEVINLVGGQEKWVAPADADKKTNPNASDPKSLATGKDIFIQKCAICHGKKGKGDGPKSAELDKPVPDFTKGDFSKQSDGAIFWKIAEGRKPMPSFKSELSEVQRWQVIIYLRELGKTTTSQK